MLALIYLQLCKFVHDLKISGLQCNVVGSSAIVGWPGWLMMASVQGTLQSFDVIEHDCM
jgi:5,10-methylene-tetrahydrofolate dehydrogenase/methenyl tetrahydrofolate cyclohydrolase